MNSSKLGYRDEIPVLSNYLPFSSQVLLLRRVSKTHIPTSTTLHILSFSNSSFVARVHRPVSKALIDRVVGQRNEFENERLCNELEM